jgi:hypothetical protein
MKSIAVCALMISVVMGSMLGAVDQRIEREDGTPSAAKVTDDGFLIDVEGIEGNRFSVYEVLGTTLLVEKSTDSNGFVAMTAGGQKLFLAKTTAKAPYMDSGVAGALEVKEVQVRSQLWIAPNGTKWRETIDNTGTITKVQVP